MNIDTSERNGEVVASFPVEPAEQLMLVTDQGKLIRMPVKDIRIAGRATQGVTLFKVAEAEQVVSAARIRESDDEGDDSGEDSGEAAVEGVTEGETAPE